MTLKFKRDVVGCFGKKYSTGDIVKYFPWMSEWHGMDESERVAKGIFVICYGQGEFDVFTRDDIQQNSAQ